LLFLFSLFDFLFFLVRSHANKTYVFVSVNAARLN
jgi:hypothetical protein